MGWAGGIVKMETNIRIWLSAFILTFITSTLYSLLPTPSFAQQTVGAVTTVQKKVHVTHPGRDQVLLVSPGDGVLFLDTYETEAEARAKLLFVDDSLLTLGEKTRLQITENVFDPDQNRRSAVMKLLSGRVRVLVGKVFTGAGSKFEIHTPTAVAASRGTYYIVWMFDQNGAAGTGVGVLEGEVEVRNLDPNVAGSVRLGPNQYTTVSQTAPPASPASMEAAMRSDLLAATEAPDEVKDSIPFRFDQVEPSFILDVKGGTVSFPWPKRKSDLPAVPDILQQPSLNRTPVNVEIKFP